MQVGVVAEFEPGMFALTTPPWSTVDVVRILKPDPPYLWIVRHWPGTHIHWWAAKVPLSESGSAQTLQVRGLQFDIQLTVPQFQALEPEFRHGGLILLQLTRQVSDTLRFDALPESSRWTILRQNGLYLHIDLPHRGEHAGLVSPDRGVLESIAATMEPAGEY